MPLALHRIGYNLDTLKADGCQLVEPEELFRLLLIETSGNPCKGCCYFKNGTCPAYLKHHTDAIDKKAQADYDRTVNYQKSHSDQSGLIGGKWANMSIKQIAEKEGISLNKARENKRAGLYRS